MGILRLAFGDPELCFGCAILLGDGARTGETVLFGDGARAGETALFVDGACFGGEVAFGTGARFGGEAPAIDWRFCGGGRVWRGDGLATRAPNRFAAERSEVPR